MKFTTLSRRTAAAGAASALVAGALVGATATAVQAAPISNDYICDGPTTDFPVTLDSDIPLIGNFPSIPAGFDATAGALDVANTFTVPAAVVEGLSDFGVTRIDATGFEGAIGTTNVEIVGVGADVADAVDNNDGTYSFDAPGSNAAFELPAAGTYDVLSPDDFTLVAKNSNGDTVLTAVCTATAAPQAYVSLPVTKNESESTATAKSPVAKGDPVKVKVKVAAPNETPGGKVVLKLGTKTVDSGNLNAKGVATLKYTAKKVGKNSLKAIYKGDGYTNGSKDSVVVKVTR